MYYLVYLTPYTFLHSSNPALPVRHSPAKAEPHRTHPPASDAHPPHCPRHPGPASLARRSCTLPANRMADCSGKFAKYWLGHGGILPGTPSMSSSLKKYSTTGRARRGRRPSGQLSSATRNHDKTIMPCPPATVPAPSDFSVSAFQFFSIF